MHTRKLRQACTITIYNTITVLELFWLLSKCDHKSMTEIQIGYKILSIKIRKERG